MAAFASIADDAAERLVHIAERAGTLTRGVGLLATASGGFAYLVGFLVLPGLWRWLWMFAGLLVSATPGLAVWFIATRLRAVVRTAPEMTDELRAATKDKAIRVALLELADLDPGNDDTAPLIQLGKDFAALDTALESHTDDLPVSSRGSRNSLENGTVRTRAPCASASVLSKSAPVASILLRMKLHVPFKVPQTLNNSSPASPSCKPEITGTPLLVRNSCAVSSARQLLESGENSRTTSPSMCGLEASLSPSFEP